MKKTNLFLATLAVLSLHAGPLSASEPIRPYLESGRSGHFHYAFADCTEVTLQDFSKSLTTIGAYAFKDCKALKDLAVPKSVTEMGKGAFRGSGVKIKKYEL